MAPSFSRLVIHDDPEWKEHYNYAEGGRKNFIEVTVELVDAAGRRISCGRVKVNLTLLDAERPDNEIDQEKLWVLDNEKKRIKSRSVEIASGYGVVRFQIKLVSSSIGGRSFRVEVAPDESSGIRILPAYTKTVLVFARKRKRDLVAEPTPSEGLIDQRNFEARRGQPAQPLASTAAQVDTAAYTHVLRFAFDVRKMLPLIQWGRFGYFSNRDGTPNFDQPVYDIKNPNELVDKVLRYYETTIKPVVDDVLNGETRRIGQKEDRETFQDASQPYLPEPTQTAGTVLLPDIDPLLDIEISKVFENEECPSVEGSSDDRGSDTGSKSPNEEAVLDLDSRDSAF